MFTYVLSAVAPTPSNVKNAQYTMFQIEDRVDALLNVKSVKVYADEAVSNNFQTMGINYSDMTSYFHVIKREWMKGLESQLFMGELIIYI